MVRPSPALQARLRLDPKKIGRGFYRGNRVGSTGAHTEYGGYIVDWRKVRNYNVPDLTGFTLTPYVTREVNARDVNPSQDYSSDPYAESDAAEASLNEDGGAQPDESTLETLQQKMKRHLTRWRNANPAEFDRYVRYQYDQRSQSQSSHADVEGGRTTEATQEDINEILSELAQPTAKKQDQQI